MSYMCYLINSMILVSYKVYTLISACMSIIGQTTLYDFVCLHSVFSHKLSGGKRTRKLGKVQG